MSVVTAVAMAAATATVAGASVAVHPKAGAEYKGSEPGCKPLAGYTCAFLFRVSADGQSMRFVAKQNVVGAWRCHGGGGEAILGPYKKPQQGQPVPALAIRTNGSFTGEQSFGTGQAKGEAVAAGRFTGAGATATITFTLDP